VMGEATLLMMGTWILTGFLCTAAFFATVTLGADTLNDRLIRLVLGFATLSFWVGLIAPNYM
jgi:hypothetical protein